MVRALFFCTFEKECSSLYNKVEGGITNEKQILKSTEAEGVTSKESAESTTISKRDDNTTFVPEASESWAEESKRETTAKETLPSQSSASSNLVVSNDSNVFKISGEMAENAAVCNSLPAMERAFFSIAEGKAEVIDNAKKQEVFDYIKANQHIGREARQNHKQRVIAYKDTIEEMEKQKICPYCKTELVLRRGKNGEFYGSRNYPKCTYTLKK